MSEKVLISKAILDSLADKISEKTGENTPLTFSEMKQAIDDISNERIGSEVSILDSENNYGYKIKQITVLSKSSDNNIYKDLWNRKSLIYFSNSISEIPPGAFLKNIKVQSINFPNCGIIRQSSFTDMGTESFEYNLPLVNIIENRAFFNNIRINKIDFPSCTEIKNSVFKLCTNVTNINLPFVKKVGSESLKELYKISSDVVLPSLQIIDGAQVFSAMGRDNGDIPIKIILPSLTKFSNSYEVGGVFSNSFNTELADLGFVTTVGSHCFESCYILSVLILRNTSLVPLKNVDAFTNTPFSGYNNLTGTVYVPNNLLNNYKTATNWSTLYDSGTLIFASLENSIYKNTNWYEE